MSDEIPLKEQIRERLGPERCEALEAQPQCLGNGGFDEVLEQAYSMSEGCPNPLIAAVVRTLQLCGSLPTPSDLDP